MVDEDDQRGVASFSLPASPVRSPTGSDNMAVWVEDTDGQQRVHLSLQSPQLSPSSSPNASCTTLALPADALDFPLVLWESSTSANHSDLPRTSSAIVPFQKLQLDTNLNQTTLPHRDSPRSRTSSVGSPGSSNGSESPAQRKSKTTTQQLASGFLGMENETTQMSQDFMNALRLGDLTPEEPQLSVRLRGGRVELASASEEEQVDFLGPAENIKRLFKLPYSQSRVSLAVHRVGSTLVVDGELDENDLPAGFEDLPQDTLQLEQQEETTQRLLYEKFIYESTVTQLPAPETESAMINENKKEVDSVVNKTKMKMKRHGKKSKKTKKAKHKGKLETLTGSEPQSQKLQDSVELLAAAEQGGDNVGPPVPPPSITGFTSEWAASESHTDAANHHRDPTPPGSEQKSTPPFVPTENNWFASTAQNSPAFGGDSQTFQRILKWKFNDLKMILGSQVLLFSNPEHPAVSLKLHDMDKELSLCTVLDYYLDNVIANIPELAICMHSKGLVRGYKLVETRQIPYMSGTGRPLFDVQDVSMNASMLLKFLQENCSRQNGTYWLHRKEGESSLRLYDVDVLSQGSQLKWKYMMAMLCYRFAARASRLANSLAAGSPQLQQQLLQRQRELLRTCMSLLGEIAQKGGTAHSSICSSVSEQLADTYLRECNQLHSSNPEESADSKREAAIGSLEKAKQYLHSSIKLFEECVPKDSGSAITHSDDGTDQAEVFESEGELAPDDEDGEMGSFMDEELNRLQLKFSSACIELGNLYAGSHKWTDAINCIVDASEFLTLSSIPDDVLALDLSSPDQDAMVNALLDKLDFDGVGKGGFSHDHIAICLSGTELRCSLLGLIGDIAAQKPTSVSCGLTALYDIISGVQRDKLPSLCGTARDFFKKLDEDAKLSDSNTLASREENLMMLSFLAYLRALSPAADSELYFLMMKKLGNASNELGKYFLAQKRDYKEAFRWFERGCKIFNDIEDCVNVALLRANLAHLHKIFAQGKPADSREEHYQTAIKLCMDALQLLKQSKADVDLHRKVKGELALTYLVWAVDMANSVCAADATRHSPTKNRENEALKLFNKALSLYAELGDDKQVASTHYQIASFYSRMISNTLRAEKESTSDKSIGSSSTLTSRMEIARRHYEKALNYFGAVEIGKTFVLIHQELADLHVLGGRVEGIEHALLILLNTFEAFNLVSKDSTLVKEEMASLARDIVTKVKAVLHQLIRLISSGLVNSANSSHAKSKKLEMFKKMYKEVIYYNGYSAGSVVPMLGTLRGMYSS